MEQLNEVEDKGTCDKGLGNSGISLEETEKDNPENKNFNPQSAHSVVGMKAGLPVVDFTASKSADEEIEGRPNNPKNEAPSASLNNAANNNNLNPPKSADEEIEGRPNNPKNEAPSAPLNNAANNNLNPPKSADEEIEGRSNNPKNEAPSASLNNAANNNNLNPPKPADEEIEGRPNNPKNEAPSVSLNNAANNNNLNPPKPADEEIEGRPNNSKNEAPSVSLKNAANNNLNLAKNHTQEFWLTEAPANEVSPKSNGAIHKIYKLTQIRSSSLDHNYCRMGNIGFLPRKIKIRKSTCLKAQSGNTFKFQNGALLGKRIMEQQTINLRNSITTNHVVPNSDLSDSNSVEVELKGKTVSQNNSYSPCAANVNINKNSVTFLTPKIRIRKSKGSDDYYDVIVQDNASKPPPFVAAESDSSEIKKSDSKLECQNPGAKAEQKPESRKRVIGSCNIAGQVSEMEKIGEPASDALPGPGGKHGGNAGLKNNDVPPVKIRKLSGKEDVSQSQNEGGFVFSNANLTKTVPGDKNWNLEYTEDDVKNLGLDDLLLKASELNAENFTKALGQSSGGRNGNKVDSPGIVLSFPAGKRASNEPLDGDNPNGGNAKKAKLEIMKKCVLDDKFMKTIEEESLKKAPELPKKPGLKVKTVQNINAEFKDSLGAKMKMTEGRDVAPGSSIPVFTINDDVQECNQTKEVFIQGKATEKQPALLSYAQEVSKPKNPTKNVNGISAETRPYIMTMIPNKENHAKNHMPVVALTPKVLIKPKSVFQNRATILPAIEGRPGDAANNKMPGGRDSSSKSNDNVTLAVPEPRSFEVVNVNGYPDAGAKKTGMNSHFVVNYGSLTKKDSNGKNIVHATLNGGAGTKNIPIVLTGSKQYLRVPLVSSQKLLISPAADKIISCTPYPQNKLVNSSPEGTANIRRENGAKGVPSFTISSVEPRIIMKDARPGMGAGNFIRVIQKVVSPQTAEVKTNPPQPEVITVPEVQNPDNVPQQKPQVMSLPAFANILKDIIPDKWILYMDKKFGLQILKTHLDDYLNPTIMMSVIVGMSGKVTVNVRGRQLEDSHELFNNLCDVGNSQNKISINYILALMNRLKYYCVCFGCDDLSLKKYWCEDGFIEYYTEYQQTYRSHICESLIRMGRKRCHPCYRMHESLKKRKRREMIAQKAGKLPKPKPAENIANVKYSMTHNSQEKGLKRTWEDYMDEALFLMKRSLKSEIQRVKEKEESERVPKTQDEVLGSMGLARKQSLDVNVRKSKRVKKGLKKRDSVLATNVNKEELYFLEKYWREIYVLFTTSLLVGGYSRLSTGILRDKCKKFYRLLATWRKIVHDDAVCVGGYFGLAENLVTDGQAVNSDFVKKKFENMDDAALRSYAINCVKELNRMKLKLRTKNKCFMTLYTTFMKPNIRKAKQTSEAAGPSGAKKNSAAKKKKTPEKSKKVKASTSTEMGSSD